MKIKEAAKKMFSKISEKRSEPKFCFDEDAPYFAEAALIISTLALVAAVVSLMFAIFRVVLG